jgi:hypothetical protein
MANGEQWADARRIEEWAGEVRVNLIRLAAVLVFYGHHLLQHYLFRDEATRDVEYHVLTTLLVVAWSTEVLALHLCLSRRWLPPWLKYAATACDIGLITLLLLLGQDPHSTLAVLYFLVIGGAALRLSLPLVQAATLGCMAAYAVFQGYFRFWLDVPEGDRVPRAQQIIFLLALGAAGIIAGQVVRQARRLVHGYPVRVADPEREEATPPAES